MIAHPFAPVWNADSRVLVLGSFPSVKSRETAFYYGHPRNRFWTVTAFVFGEETPVSVAEKTGFLLRNGIALWDCAARCEIEGSSDASIRSVVPNDILPILRGADIRGIFANGRTAFALYERLLRPVTGRRCLCLPSTSPANCRVPFPELARAWKAIV